MAISTVSVSLMPSAFQPHAHVLSFDSGQSFITVKLHPDVSIILDGFDLDSVHNARDLAAVLTKAADDLAEKLKDAPPPTIDAVPEAEILL